MLIDCDKRCKFVRVCSNVIVAKVPKTMTSKACEMEHLPDEILLHIFSYMSIKDLITSSRCAHIFVLHCKLNYMYWSLHTTLICVKRV